MPEVITSPSNPKVKRLLALQQKSSARREAGLFVVEGQRELQHCIDAGFEIDSVFYCPLRCGDAPRQNFASLIPPTAAQRVPPIYEAMGGHGFAGEVSANAKLFEVSEEVYAKIAMREGTEGVIAEVRAKDRRLEDLALPERPLVVVLESVEKPGNLGAVLRSADAAGVDAVLFCDPLTDLWNPNLIRASIGAVFTVPCVACSSAEAIAFLKARGIRILTAQLQDSSL